MFSLIIPIFNEENNIIKLYNEIIISLKNYNKYEIIFVNDSSTDKSDEFLKELSKKDNVQYFSNKTNKGQSFSIRKGINNSNYDIIVTLDGDCQNNPKDIPKLLKIYNSSENITLVGGIRHHRKDSFLKILSSKIANKFRSFILNDNCIDTGCSLKVFDKNIFLSLPFFDGIHRFLPALFKTFGKKNVFVNVDHRRRFSGQSKYGITRRMFKGIRDLIKVLIILKKKNV